MKLSSLVLGASALVVAFAQGACDTEGFGKPRGGLRLAIELKGQDDVSVVGTRLAPLALTTDIPQPFVTPDQVREFVPDSGEGTATSNDPFRVSPEFEELLALQHPPAGTRPWEHLGIPR